jgi:hypothetical protein
VRFFYEARGLSLSDELEGQWSAKEIKRNKGRWEEGIWLKDLLLAGFMVSLLLEGLTCVLRTFAPKNTESRDENNLVGRSS